jgi:hypothetical protein
MAARRFVVTQLMGTNATTEARLSHLKPLEGLFTNTLYVVTRRADGTYVVRADSPGLLTFDEALDECARLNAQEDERRRREKSYQ